MAENKKPEINIPNPVLNANGKNISSYFQRYYKPPANIFRTMPPAPYILPNIPGFDNAKKISMRERGWQLFFPFELELEHMSVDIRIIGQNVLIAQYDGPETEAILLSIQKDTTNKNSNKNRMKDIFAFQADGKTWEKTRQELHDENIQLYKKVRPVAFKQGGGFYPSVYGGITGASMLAPLVARQTLRMYNNTTKKRRKSKKRTLRKKNFRK